MLLEIAVGDAYGAGFEFSSRDKIHRHNDLNQYVGHDLGFSAGHYTDDTQMSIAVAEVLLENGENNRPTRETFAHAFIRCYKRDPRPGYAKGLQSLLDECRDGVDLLHKIRPESRRNGAAMRSVPVGLLPDIDQVKQVSRAHAIITHDTDEGVLSAQIVALMAHVLLYEQMAFVDVAAFIQSQTGFVLANDWNREVECDALQTLHAVHTVLLRHRRLSELLVAAVDFGGDTDSVAAITSGLASLSREYINDIPIRLIETLESGPYGRSFLEAMDARLAERFPKLRFGG
jgi:ADP-ribosylglycohydrolase